MKKYILAFDQGTTSSRSILFDRKGNILHQASQPFRQIYPKPGYVEHDPEEILKAQISSAEKVIKEAGISVPEICAVGITNQRETTVVWDKRTGKPVHNAIVWQCRRTAPLCETLKEKGFVPLFQKKTGLTLDAYFSATKIKWILDQDPAFLKEAQEGNYLFGTMDTWLMWKLSKGSIFATDYSNASRTMLYHIHDLCWDEEILSILGIPKIMLPEVRPSSYYYGDIDPSFFGEPLPIMSVLGDQQAALFGHGCFEEGYAKNTYGTGCFFLINTGKTPVRSENGLVTTIAWGIGNEVTYALEGSVFIAGAVIQWLRDEMGILKTSAESEQMALSVPDTLGVYLVPAFTGLGAPTWDMSARGTVVGLTRGVNKNHFVRAALESIAYQSADVINASLEDMKNPLKVLKVDGGATQNNFLMQFQADILKCPVMLPNTPEMTALGAAYMAGLTAGVFEDLADIQKNNTYSKTFYPAMPEKEADQKYQGWLKALEAAKAYKA